MSRAYFEITHSSGVTIAYEEDGFRYCFAEDPANTDYQEYLAWLAEGNEPEAISATPDPISEQGDD